MLFILSNINQFDDLLEKIETEYSVENDGNLQESKLYFDTFDWRLFRRDLNLFVCNSTYYLNHLQNGDNPTIQKCGRVPKFYPDFPKGVLREKLKPILQMRALLPLIDVQKNSRRFKILNDDQKTILRLLISENHLKTDKNPVDVFYGLKLLPVRGYEQSLKKLRSWLNEAGIDEQEANEFIIYCRALNLKPGAYTSKINIEFNPKINISDAATTIYKYLLNITDQNEAGILADIDSEFLHDFRVSVRRTRSALGQIKNVLPTDAESFYKKEFSYLGKLSNRLRDLDVYLLDEEKYRQMLPENLRDSIKPLFQRLRRERRSEYRKFVKSLKTERVVALRQSWQEFLYSVQEVEHSPENAPLPAIQVARKIIYKRFKKIIAAGHKIDANSPAELLHALRIECKKLRYLLEFFASLFPAEKISFLIKQLKKLQDNLGTFNDLIIQQEMLNRFLAQIKANQSYSVSYAAALGCLIGILSDQQKRVRENFEQTFAVFSNKKNKQLFRELFKDS